jgi:DNA repair exonuclease SbcCD ATPase subunit
MNYSEQFVVLEDQLGETHRLMGVAEGELSVAQGMLDNVQQKLDTAEKDADTAAQALDVLRAYAELQEKGLQEKVGKIVTEGLRAVFERSDIEFGLRFELARGQMTATPIIKTGDVETEAKDARGGGVLDVASFLLRCVMLVLTRPKLERVLVLDEIFKHLSRNHLQAAGSLVKEMSERLGIQMIMVSHKEEMTEAADKVFDVSIHDGKTKIEERV